MRINIYNEELTNRIEFVRRRAKNTGAEFCGLRFYLLSPEELHHGPDDDDQSAVTFWSNSPEKLVMMFSKAIEVILKSK